MIISIKLDSNFSKLSWILPKSTKSPVCMKISFFPYINKKTVRSFNIMRFSVKLEFLNMSGCLFHTFDIMPIPPLLHTHPETFFCQKKMWQVNMNFTHFMRLQNEQKYDFFSISRISFCLLVITLVVKIT